MASLLLEGWLHLWYRCGLRRHGGTLVPGNVLIGRDEALFPFPHSYRQWSTDLPDQRNPCLLDLTWGRPELSPKGWLTWCTGGSSGAGFFLDPAQGWGKSPGSRSSLRRVEDGDVRCRFWLRASRGEDPLLPSLPLSLPSGGGLGGWGAWGTPRSWSARGPNFPLSRHSTECPDRKSVV